MLSRLLIATIASYLLASIAWADYHYYGYQGRIRYPDPVSEFIENQRIQKDIELKEMELRQRQFELETYRKEVEREEQMAGQGSAVTRPATSADGFASAPLILRCDFPAPERAGRYRSVSELMLRVDGTGIAIRDASGWVPVQHDIRDDELLAAGLFITPIAVTGETVAVPNSTMLAIDRFTGSAVIYADAEEADHGGIPMFPGKCAPAQRQF
jgi:hypothetical protein